MLKNKKSLKNHPFVKWVIIPIILFVMWIGLTIFYMGTYDNSFLVLSYNHDRSSYKQIPDDRLTKGEKIKGEFMAKENDLGIVSIRFDQYLRIPYKDEDTVVFRIKEKGASKWYYENTYKSGLTFDTPYLPFGFPPIKNSKDKIYVFEIESLHGNNKNGISVSDRQPNLSSKYQVSKTELMQNKLSLVVFLYKKFILSLLTIDILISTIIYSLPFILYRINNSRFFQRLGMYPAYLFLLLITFDTIFLQINNDFLYIVSMVTWVGLVKYQRDREKYSFFSSFFFFFMSIVFLALNKVPSALSSSSWSFIFLLTALLQVLVTFNNNKVSKDMQVKKKNKR